MNFRMVPKTIAFGLSTFAALALSFFLSFPVEAQVVGATLSGTVRDASGSGMPNVNVSIKNVATEVTREVTTDQAGFYLAPNLLPGNYDVTTSASGFSTQTQSGITLTVGAQQVLDVTMKLGQVTQRVEVIGEAPTVQLATSSIDAIVNSTTVTELPLNGRSWTDLAALQPGVDAIQAQADYSTGSHRGSRGFGDQITVSGARPQWNNYRLDGVSINDYSNGGPGSVIGGNLGVDAIQEFSVITNNYSAEYGRTAGGVVNAITRSGTNQFHGGAYEFLRNNDLDARNYFDTTELPFRRNQFGADAGAPIRKDKLFVFGDYEGIRQSKGITAVETVPSVAARSGMLCSAPSSPSACTPTTVTVAPSVQQYLPFYPVPNGGIDPGSNGNIGLLYRPYQEALSENFFTIRVDNKFSDKDSLDFTYQFDFAPFTQPSTLGTDLFGSITHQQVATLGETHILSPTLVNSVRVGYSREYVVNNVGLSAINPLAKDQSLGALPDFTAAQVNVSGLTGFIGGLGVASGFLITWNSFQGYDDVSWTHGTNTLKFGGGVERIQDDQFKTPAGGAFTFSSLSNFLTNVPSRFSIVSSAVDDGFRYTDFGLYMQDDWRVRPNLTLNMGLRWEMVNGPAEVHSQLANLINITDPTQHLGSPLYPNSTLRNFDPRVGFSWDPFQNGKTAVRGAFGVFDVLPLPYELDNTEGQVAPFNTASVFNSLPPGSFYTEAASLPRKSTGKAAYFEQHTFRTYVMQWNLNVQRELPGRVTAVVSYVGSRGVHLPFRSDDADIVLPTLTTAGYLYPNPIGSGTRVNPNYGQVISMFYGNNSDYNGLQMGVKKAMSHGLQVQGSFTWNRGFDSGSSSVAGDQFTNSISSLPFYNMNSLRGPSDFNINRTLVINFTWLVPSPKSFSGPAAWITKGWQLGAIYTASDGIPFTPTFGNGGDPQGLESSDPWAFPDRLGGAGCQSLINPGNVTNYIKTQCFSLPVAPNQAFWQANCDTTSKIYGSPATTEPYPVCFNLRGNAGRNILTGPGLSNLDFSVFKDNGIKRISETFNVQFRAEFFNILNRANFSFPMDPSIFNANGLPNSTAGLITGTATDSREIQFALKVKW